MSALCPSPPNMPQAAFVWKLALELCYLNFSTGCNCGSLK